MFQWQEQDRQLEPWEEDRHVSSPQAGSLPDRLVGCLLIVLGLVSLLEARRLRPLRGDSVVGDDTFPVLIGIALVLIGAVLIISRLPPKPVIWPQRWAAVAMIKTLGVLALYWLLIPQLGYLFSTFLVAAGLFHTIGRYKWYFCLLGAAVVAGIFHYIFVMGLRMPFPLGVFGV